MVPVIRRRQGAWLGTKLARQKFKWQIVEHPLYIPELAPIDYHLFLRLKELWARQSLRGDQDTKYVVQDWQKSWRRPFAKNAYKSWSHEHVKCLS